MKKRISILVLLLVFLASCNKKSKEEVQSPKIPKYGKHYKYFKKIGIKKGDRVNAQALHLKAFSEYNKKDIEKAISFWLEAAKKDPSWYVPFFNLACMNSLLKNKEETLGFLILTLKRNPSLKMVNKLKSDSDLKFIRTISEFNTIINKYSKKIPKTFLGGFASNSYCQANMEKFVLPANYSWSCGGCSVTIKPSGYLVLGVHAGPSTYGTYTIKNNKLFWKLKSSSSAGDGTTSVNKSGVSSLKFINHEVLCFGKIQGVKTDALDNYCYCKTNADF